MNLMSAGTLLLPWTLTAILVCGFGRDVASQVAGPSDGSVTLPSTGVGRGLARPLPFFYDVFTFRGEGGRTTVVAAFAVESGELETERVGDNNRYRFSVTLELADTALRSVTNRHDTVFADLPRQVRDEHLLYTHIEVEAPPSSDIQQRVTMIDATEAGIGQLYWKYTRIPDYSGAPAHQPIPVERIRRLLRDLQPAGGQPVHDGDHGRARGRQLQRDGRGPRADPPALYR